jgi:hypothetical protein
MNLKEVKKKDRPFKRKDKDKYFVKVNEHTDIDGCTCFMGVYEDASDVCLSGEDLFADDWEIKPIKRTQVFENLDSYYIGHSSYAYHRSFGLDQFNDKLIVSMEQDSFPKNKSLKVTMIIDWEE